jgi:pyruvate formate lyase activating enzyme
VRVTIPLIAGVKRHSLEDGPGIRSVVFFKGCPLRCVFCQNPETQRPAQEIVFRAERCVRCGACIAVCPLQAVSLDAAARIDWRRCDDCGNCVAICPASALAHVGRDYGVDELVELLMRDEPYYRHSGGGVTLSGGECTMFPDYLEGLAWALKEREIHLLVETAGEFDGTWFMERLLPLLDLVYFDVKIADPAQHRIHTGRDNRRILDNLALLMRVAPDRVQVRIPLVPDITATRENLTGLAVCLRERGVESAILLPYNPLGLHMASRLGRDTPTVCARFMSKEELASAVGMFDEAVARCVPSLLRSCSP